MYFVLRSRSSKVDTAKFCRSGQISLPPNTANSNHRHHSPFANCYTQTMSTPEESPAQKAARMRRERRDAKLKEGGAARLDKITSMSGRTPASGMR